MSFHCQSQFFHFWLHRTPNLYLSLTTASAAVWSSSKSPSSQKSISTSAWARSFLQPSWYNLDNLPIASNLVLAAIESANASPSAKPSFPLLPWLQCDNILLPSEKTNHALFERLLYSTSFYLKAQDLSSLPICVEVGTCPRSTLFGCTTVDVELHISASKSFKWRNIQGCTWDLDQ